MTAPSGGDRGPPGRLSETYLAALQNDLVDLDGSERLVGVVRRPTPWFNGAVDENRPALGPPEALLEEFKDRHEELSLHGMCDEGAHNAAWQEVRFKQRYLDYLADDDAARAALDDLVAAVEGGESIVLVCFEGDDKRCHRHLLKRQVENRID